MFTTNEKRILNLLYVAGRPLSTRLIAKKLKISWSTARDALEALQKSGYVRSERRGLKVFWWLKEG